MKKMLFVITYSLSSLFVFAQRGKVRPEWDFDGGRSVSHHNIDNDMYSFLFIIGIIVIVLIFAAIKGNMNKQKVEKRKEPPIVFKAIGSIWDVYSTIVGWGCLISIVIAPIMLIVSLVKGCSHRSSDKLNNKTEQRKNETIVETIISENFIQSHKATEDEFIGADTIYYYKNYVYQNCTGKTLAIYSVEYCINGKQTWEIVRTISPNSYFDTGLYLTKFERPPGSVDIHVPTGYSRWARSQRTKATSKKYFIDYLENYHKYKSLPPTLF